MARPPAVDWSIADRMFINGCTDAEVLKATGVKKATWRQHRYRHGLDDLRAKVALAKSQVANESAKERAEGDCAPVRGVVGQQQPAEQAPEPECWVARYYRNMEAFCRLNGIDPNAPDWPARNAPQPPECAVRSDARDPNAPIDDAKSRAMAFQSGFGCVLRGDDVS